MVKWKHLKYWKVSAINDTTTVVTKILRIRKVKYNLFYTSYCLNLEIFTFKNQGIYKVSNSLQGRWPTFGNTLSWIRCIRDTHDICIASMTGPSYVNVDICLEITRDLHDTLILNFTFICIFKEFFLFVILW